MNDMEEWNDAEMLTDILLIGAGGFLGAIARFLCVQFFNSSHFPNGTLLVNGSGSFLLGYLFGSNSSETMLLFWGVGFCGAYTTFSTMKMECLTYLQNKDRSSFFLYLSSTYLFGILLAFIGFSMAS